MKKLLLLFIFSLIFANCSSRDDKDTQETQITSFVGKWKGTISMESFGSTTGYNGDWEFEVNSDGTLKNGIITYIDGTPSSTLSGEIEVFHPGNFANLKANYSNGSFSGTFTGTLQKSGSAVGSWVKNNRTYGWKGNKN